MSKKFQSTRPVWGATFNLPTRNLEVMSISIHAPRVGRDLQPHSDQEHGGISIHAPRVGRDYLELLPSPLV